MCTTMQHKWKVVKTECPNIFVHTMCVLYQCTLYIVNKSALFLYHSFWITLYITPPTVAMVQTKSNLFYYLSLHGVTCMFMCMCVTCMLNGELRHKSRCNRSASQRASSQYVMGHGHVTYAPFIYQIPCFYDAQPQIGDLPINGTCATYSCAMIY